MEINVKSIHPLISKRRSVVSFSPDSPDHSDMELLFDAARWAPSSRNAQPWSFIYALKEDEAEFKKLADLLNEGNYWAREAPVLILSMAQVISDYQNKPNHYAMHDLGMATANLMIQATSMGLYLHPMAGFDAKKAVEVFKIPDNVRAAAMIALGYHGEIDHLPIELKRRELAKRTRKELSEFVFQGSYGNPAPKISL